MKINFDPYYVLLVILKFSVRSLVLISILFIYVIIE